MNKEQDNTNLGPALPSSGSFSDVAALAVKSSSALGTADPLSCLQQASFFNLTLNPC